MIKDKHSNLDPDAQQILNRIVLDYQQEQRRKRRWRIITRSILLVIIVYAIYLWKTPGQMSGYHVGLVDLNGTIALGREGDADEFMKGLDRAYKSANMKALIIRINSPGGSPVQGEYMYNALRYYRSKYPAIHIYAVCVDVCASAAYYVAAAADEIYASPASMVGSIGVVFNGFGFVDGLQKIGVSRRLFTAGKNKGFLDPFSPLNPEQESFLQTMLDVVHKQFINRVKAGRGSRLKIDDSTFSGLFWTGEQALARGLIDGFASSEQLAREIIKVETVVDYSSHGNVLDRVSKNFGMAIANQLPQAIQLQTGWR